MKNLFNKIHSFYCRHSQIIFYILAFCLLAAVLVTASLAGRKNKEKKEIEQSNILPQIQVTENSLDKTLLYNHLEEHGLARQEIFEIVNRLDKIMYTRRLAPRDKFMLSFDEETGAFKMLVVKKDLTHYYVAKLAGGDYVAGIMDKEIKTRKVSAAGEIHDSLYVSMQKKGLQVPLITAFADVFSWTIDFNSDTRNGDRFAAVWEEDYTSEGIVGQTIAAAKYKGLYAGENYAYFYKDDFFEESGKMTKRFFLKSPISFARVRITSRFSHSRLHPIHRVRRPHLGIDYAAPTGTPVEVVADGTVTYAGWKAGFGNYLEVTHTNNYTTCYGHLKNYTVKKGQRVKQGSVIGYVGSTGESTGPHLDFRVRENKKYIDFLSIRNRNSTSKTIPEEEMDEFKKVVEKYKKILDADEE